jgi:hypothetical protein
MFLRDPFLMRFLFFGFGDADKSLQVIDEQIRVYEDQMKMRRQNMSRWRRQESHVRLIAELGLSLNEMYLQWLLRAREEIASNMKSKES